MYAAAIAFCHGFAVGAYGTVLETRDAGLDADAEVAQPAQELDQLDRVAEPALGGGPRCAGPARRVTNIVIQDLCPTDAIEHDQAPNDPVVHQLVLEALSQHRAPADPTPEINCLAAPS